MDKDDPEERRGLEHVTDDQNDEPKLDASEEDTKEKVNSPTILDWASI